jgi:hypothetical protein
VAADQVVSLWRGEAQSGGPGAVERFARRTLVDELRQDLPGGWRADWTAADSETKAAASRLALSTGRWLTYLDDEHESAGSRVLDAMLDAGRDGSISEGWLPADADDPMLAEIFRIYWCDPVAPQR